MSDPNLSIPVALRRRLDEAATRWDELQRQLNDPQVLSSPPRLVNVSREAGRLEPLVTRYRQLQKAIDNLAAVRELAGSTDSEMAALAREDLPRAEAEALRLLESLKDEFVASEDNRVDSFFLEIRAGIGGEEAALFAHDLFEMYRRYVAARNWTFEVAD
ncbi:MAG: PCRF domain-containing protein, partial [Phycisphaerae bacterium]|nr:PCRF domain-containing protein [Phycisphaerae bacterium]